MGGADPRSYACSVTEFDDDGNRRVPAEAARTLMADRRRMITVAGR